MSRLETYIDPQTTRHLLNNLNLAIDEAKLVMNITALKNHLFSIEEANSDSSDRTQFIQNEIKNLELQLDVVRDHADVRMGLSHAGE